MDKVECGVISEQVVDCVVGGRAISKMNRLGDGVVSEIMNNKMGVKK